MAISETSSLPDNCQNNLLVSLTNKQKPDMIKLPSACDSANDWSETSAYESSLVRQPDNKYNT